MAKQCQRLSWPFSSFELSSPITLPFTAHCLLFWIWASPRTTPVFTTSPLLHMFSFLLLFRTYGPLCIFSWSSLLLYIYYLTNLFLGHFREFGLGAEIGTGICSDITSQSSDIFLFCGLMLIPSSCHVCAHGAQISFGCQGLIRTHRQISLDISSELCYLNQYHQW